MARTGNHGQVIPRDADLLRRLYWVENHTLPEIGAMFGVTHKSVERVFRDLGISRRKVGQSRRIICACGSPAHKAKHATNGSFYGTRCQSCRRKHYAELAREYSTKAEVKAKKRAYLRHWYLNGALNPNGELQWLNKGKILLRNARRLLVNPQSPAACESRNAALNLERTLRA